MILNTLDVHIVSPLSPILFVCCKFNCFYLRFSPQFLRDSEIRHFVFKVEFQQVFKKTMDSIELKISLKFPVFDLSNRISLDLTGKENGEVLGEVDFIPSINTSESSALFQEIVQKRKPESNISIAPKFAKVQKTSNKFARQKSNFALLEHDLISLKLMPEIESTDLSCKMCDYRATQKGHLKTHYKLKHFGGADLIMQCQICEIKLKTKSYMKKHYIKIHKLTDMAASNMCVSSSA